MKIKNARNLPAFTYHSLLFAFCIFLLWKLDFSKSELAFIFMGLAMIVNFCAALYNLLKEID